MSTTKKPGYLYQIDPDLPIESPFLNEEFLLEESSAKRESQLVALESESPFLEDIDGNQSTHRSDSKPMNNFLQEDESFDEVSLMESQFESDAKECDEAEYALYDENDEELLSEFETGHDDIDDEYDFENPDSYPDNKLDAKSDYECEEMENLKNREGAEGIIAAGESMQDNTDFDENELQYSMEQYPRDFDSVADELEEGIDNELNSYDFYTPDAQPTTDENAYFNVAEEHCVSYLINNLEYENDSIEDLASLSEHDDLLESYIPASRLKWPTASLEQLQFMRAVYDAHIAISNKMRKFLPSLKKSQLSKIEGYWLQKDAANAIKILLQAVRNDIKKTNQNIQIKITSGYRSANRQFFLWNKNFLSYYVITQRERAAMPGGIHGTQARIHLTDFTRKRIAAPGYSRHQSGIAVDLLSSESKNGINLKISSFPSNIKNWKKSWFWHWLENNAATYGFYQNTKIKEPWHWVYRGHVNSSGQSKSSENSRTSIQTNSLATVLKKGMDNIASFKQAGRFFYIAVTAISKGERDENKITNILFYDKYPHTKGKKLKRNDPLAKDWLNIRNNIARPLLGKLSTTKNHPNIGSIIPETNVSYVQYSNGQLKKITPESVLWLAKMIDAETWGKPTEDDAKSMLWALIQRTAIWKFRTWEWKRMIQAYSQPINPRWTRTGNKCSKYYKPGYVGVTPNNCNEKRVNKRAANIQKKWEDLHPIARQVVLEFIAGKIPNHIPGVVGWFAPGTWWSRDKKGINLKDNMVHHSEIDGNIYFAMNNRPDTTKWTGHEVTIKTT